MGLDIAFNREKALAAGLKVRMVVRGTEEEIAKAKAEGESQYYIDYLSKPEEFIEVPGTEFLASNDGVDSIVVRANKWGRVYEPLTTWLKVNNIEWGEF